MFTVSECDLISNTLTSHDSAPIRGRPTLKDAEQFRTGSIIHESKNTFGYVKTCINIAKNTQKVAKNIIQKVNKNVTKVLLK